MRYAKLIEILQEKYEISPYVSNNSPKIKDVRLLGDTIKKWDKNTIYLGSLDKLNNKPNKPIMLFSTDNKSISHLLPEGSNCCYIHNKDLSDLFNKVKDLIYENLRIQADLFEISKTALEEKNIIKIINTAANLVGNALILVDSNMRVLAHSTIYEIMDSLWADNIERGHYSYEFMSMVRSSEQMREWSKLGDETRIITLPGDIQPKLVSRITRDGRLVGALIMIAHHTPINNHHIRELPIIGKMLFDVLFDVFSSSDSGKLYKSFYSNILYNLLDEEDVTDTLELMNMAQANFPEEMYVVVARFVRRVTNRYLKLTVSIELKHIFPDGYPVHYKNYIGILVSSISANQRKRLADLVQNEDISIGISWSFTDIVQFKRYFYQAVIAIKQAQHFNKTRQVFDYTDFSYYDLLWNYNGNIPLKHYCHPALEVLRNYDNSNNTEFYITLRTYLENNKNLSKTAKALFIHRNSLLYRINRINELTKLDLDDTNVLFSLIDSFRIERFMDSMLNRSCKL